MNRTLLQQALDALHPQARPAFVEATKDALRAALAQPEPEPVAWLVEGWHDGKLIAHIPHLSLDDAKTSASVFSQHYTTTKTVPLYATPPAAPAPADLTPFERDLLESVGQMNVLIALNVDGIRTSCEGFIDSSPHAPSTDADGAPNDDGMQWYDVTGLPLNHAQVVGWAEMPEGPA